MKDNKITIRSFIAIELSEEARGALDRLQGRLKEILPPKTVRWAAPKNIHLTLHFLGEVSVDHLETVGHAVRDVAAATPPFFLSLAGLGAFPNTRRPRIVWVAVSGKTDILVRLHRELGRLLQKGIRFQPETRPYSPHLTIGRVRKGTAQQPLHRLGQLLEEEIPKVGELAALPVEQIHFIRSDLKPHGPVYTRLVNGVLKG